MVIEEYLQKPCAQVLEYMIDEDRFHLVLLHNHIHALFRFFIKYWDQHIFEISVAVLAKTKSNLLVRICMERAAANINMKPMSEYLPNSVFILHIFGLNYVHYLQADVPLSHLLGKLRLRLPYQLQGREVLLLMDFLKYLLSFFPAIFSHHLLKNLLDYFNPVLFKNQ